MEEKKISEQESLELITRMINQTKKDLSVGNGDSFLMWGYLSAAISLAVIVMLLATNDPRYAWLYIGHTYSRIHSLRHKGLQGKAQESCGKHLCKQHYK